MLTQQPDRYPDAMLGRVTPPGMVAGHGLTQREREAAVLALLDGGEAPKAKGKRPGWRFRRSIGLVTQI